MKARRQPMMVEDRLLAAVGTWRSFVWTLSPEPERDVIYGIGHDVTGERAQARTLAGRRAECDQLCTLSVDMLAHADCKGRMLSVSPAWSRVLGCTETGVLNTPYAGLIHTGDLQPTLTILARMGKRTSRSNMKTTS
ncbi:hypothetical protein [Falsirhodobacter sp. 1013]|uniref:hypothetical protein n=1 Tax=Falsirhodobacter sp. 1013 TaxID=3417566 RepID=UPI003EBEF0BF